MSFTLRPYQQEALNKLLNSDTNDVLQAATGFGKTAVFSKLVEHLKGNTLILVHREELMEQTCGVLSALKLDFQPLTAKTKSFKKSKIYVCMVATLKSRLKNFENYLGEIDTIIIDECHRADFDPIISHFPNARRIGFTATPVKMKKKEALCQNYDKIIIGRGIKELIKDGYLVQDVNYELVLEQSEFDKLEKSQSFGTGGYTATSLNKVFNHSNIINKCYEAHNEHSNNDKTIIFCCSIEHAHNVHAFFQVRGKNTRVFSSKSKENRTDVVEWFRNTPNAILINVDVFTTGFDVTDIQTVIIFRSTRSLSLWLQMVGRAGRPTTKIFKDNFKCIDMGNNIKHHKNWSYNHDWKAHFYDISTKELGEAPVKDCPRCGNLCHTSSPSCSDCGFVFPINKDIEINTDNAKVTANNLTPPPKINTLQLYHFMVRKKRMSDVQFITSLKRKIIKSTIIHYSYTGDKFTDNEDKIMLRIKQILARELNLVDKPSGVRDYFGKHLSSTSFKELLIEMNVKND